MNDELLKTMVFTALAGGSGGLIKWLLDQYFKDRGSDISPRTKRRLVWVAALVVPSALYGFAVLAGWATHYLLTEHASYIVASFAAATTIHGEQDLPSGAEQRVEALFAQPGVVVAIPGPGVVPREAVTDPPPPPPPVVVFEGDEEVK